jgi:hypothetical protein
LKHLRVKLRRLAHQPSLPTCAPEKAVRNELITCFKTLAPLLLSRFDEINGNKISRPLKPA